MSWNPFNKLIIPKNKPPSKSTVDREFEREVIRFNQMEVATKKIYKDMRKQLDSLSALAKAEQRMIQDLGANPVTQSVSLKDPADQWLVTVDRLDELKQELVNRNQKTVIDPMKKISRIYPSVNDAIRKREQSLQEYCKNQVKMEKQQEKEKTVQNQAKVEEVKQNLLASKADFDRQNAVMLEDLPKLVDGRIDYFEPCFEALVRSEASYYKQAVQVFDDLIKALGCGEELLTNEEYQTRLQQSISDIRSLSITEDG